MSMYPTKENTPFVIAMVDYKNDHIVPLKVGKWYSQQESIARAKKLNAGFETSAYLKALGFDEFVGYNYYKDTTDQMHDWS
jgi:hypothetical protein